MRAMVGTLTAAVLGLAVTPPAAAVDLFGAEPVVALSIEAVPRWRSVLERMAEQNRREAPCLDDPARCDLPAAAEWRRTLRELAAAPLARQLETVNRVLNRARYASDLERSGRVDVWETPWELLANGGDCEDYAIAKYASLRELGVPAARMHVVVVRDTVRRLTHAVLAVDTGTDVVVLDNVQDAILSHRALARYEAIYAVNEVRRSLLARPGSVTGALLRNVGGTIAVAPGPPP